MGLPYDPFEDMREAASQAARTPNLRAAGQVFRRQAPGSALSRLRSTFGMNTDDDEAVGGLARALQGGLRLSGMGLSPSRWASDGVEGDFMSESWGAYKTTTTSGNTGGEVEWDFTPDVSIDHARLFLWDPTGAIVGGGYWTEIKKKLRNAVLGLSEAHDFRPVEEDDLLETLGEELHAPGGIYLGPIDSDTKVSGKVYIPTSSVDVTWGLVVRGRPVSEDDAKGGLPFISGQIGRRVRGSFLR